MTLLFMDSFDHYTTVTQKYDSESVANGSAQNTISGGAGRFGSGLRIAGGTVGANANNFQKFLPATYTTIQVGMAMRYNGMTLGTSILSLLETATLHVDLRLEANRKLYATRNGTTLLVGTTTVDPNIWHYLEFKVTIHDTTGSVEVRLNGVPEFSTTGDTRNAGSGFINRVGFFGSTATGGTNFIDRDDIIIFGDNSGGLDPFLGDIRVQSLFPSAAGNSTQLTRVGTDSGANWSQVEETAPSTADSVQSSIVGDKDTYVFGNLTSAAAAVHGVQVLPFANKTDAGPRSIVSVARLGGVEEDSAAKVLTLTAQYLPDIRPTKPGGGAWTMADINNAEFGVKVVA